GRGGGVRTRAALGGGQAEEKQCEEGKPTRSRSHARHTCPKWIAHRCSCRSPDFTTHANSFGEYSEEPDRPRNSAAKTWRWRNTAFEVFHPLGGWGCLTPCVNL